MHRRASTAPSRAAFLASAALVASLHAVPARAQADADQALALLRTASAQAAIITFCPKHYAIDGTTALRISQTTRDVAAKVLGRARADAAFKDELARRFDEVKAVGEQQWCAEQRDELADVGAGIFKD
ncbi:hypothetical protein Q8W71_13100 [Methylobacterium sp. NEAU 140]|uniref:hypothetical protein n=1 Tax=Methylobacterium sp. NEAU 140 TaxID=3064945 RepID=UPI002732786E|nr:hypothetical protein [Methylobacterium sp. NEAU 140]MDP4023569.1 hypothetical protein [Methylobacterium sp. NEAU 140]